MITLSDIELCKEEYEGVLKAIRAMPRAALGRYPKGQLPSRHPELLRLRRRAFTLKRRLSALKTQWLQQRE